MLPAVRFFSQVFNLWGKCFYAVFDSSSLIFFPVITAIKKTATAKRILDIMYLLCLIFYSRALFILKTFSLFLLYL